MRSRLIQIASFLFLLACSAFGQSTTITGTIDDLTLNPVTSGKVVFTLKPSVDTTISGNARFTPGQPVTCYIQSNGTLLNAAQTGACTVVSNTSLTPAGTSYRVDICPYMACSSSFNFYAINSTYSISSIVPTPTTGPAQNFADVFSNQVVAGNKTFTGTTIFGNTTLAITNTCALNGNIVLNPGCVAGSDIGTQIDTAYAACPSVGCTIDVPAGTYSYSTPIVAATANKPLVLRCGYGATSITGTTLTYAQSTGIAINLATGLASAIKGCSFVGPSNSGSTIGLAISNAIGGAQTQSQIEGSSFSGFGTCLSFGNNVYLISFREDSFFNCTNVLSYPSGLTGSGEDIIFYGGLFQGIIGSYSTTCVNIASNAETISFSAVSFDSCGITLNAQGINFTMSGGNIENLASATSLDFFTIGSLCTQCAVALFGVNLQEDGNGAGRAHLITNGANGSKLNIIGGHYFPGSEGSISELVSSASGSSTWVENIQSFNIAAPVAGSGAFGSNKLGNSITINGPMVAASVAVGGPLLQGASNNFAGACTMTTTTCTVTVTQTYLSSPLCFAHPQNAAAAATTAYCVVSGANALVTAASSNTGTWGVMVVGNPN